MSISALKRPEENEQKYPNMQTVELLCDMLGFSSYKSGNLYIDLRKNDPIPNIDIIEFLDELPMTEEDKLGF